MTSISRLAVGGLNFGKLDSVLLSDNSTGFTDVTGQPFVSTLVPGDFDGDGDVDGADFVIWQTNFPTESGATLATGDADGDGDVDGADFVIWQTNFPFTPAPAAAPVPEPAAWLLAIFSLAGLAPRFGCGSRSHRVRKQE